MRLTWTSISGAWTLPVATAAAFIGAAPPIATQTPTLVDDRVDVRVVNVDVVVLDKKGQPVADLGREDFALFEDGRPVEIDYFTPPAARSTSPPEPVADATSHRTSPETTTAAPAAVAPVPLTVAVYLDDRATHAFHRNRVLLDLAEFLEESMQLPAEWILARFRDRLEIVAGPTPQIEEIITALPEIGEPDPRGLQWQRDERRAMSGMIASYQACQTIPLCVPCEDNWGVMLDLARSHAANESTRMALVTRGLADLVGSLSGVEGRKNVLYVGDGFELRGGLATLSYLADLCGHVRPDAQSEIFRIAVEQDNVTRLEELTAYANSNRVSLFMLDAQGVHVGRRNDVETGSLGGAAQSRASGSGLSDAAFADGARPAGPALAPTVQNDRLRMDNFQATHSAMALQTGGRAILNSHRPLGALGDVAASWTDATYSLGFTPDHPATGEMHRLEVELVGRAAKGRQLSYRRSYRDKQTEAQLVDRLISALYLDRTRNPLGVSVDSGTPKRVIRDVYDVPIEIVLPRPAFRAFPGSDDPRGQARVWLTAVHEDGTRSDVRQQYIDIEPPAGDPAVAGSAVAAPHRLVVQLELLEGASRVAVGVRDEVTQEMALLTLRVEVGGTD